MNYCEDCNQLEGDTVRIEIGGEEVRVCAHCHGELTHVPEHDDYDMER